MAIWRKIGTVGSPQGLNGSFFLVGDREQDPSSSSVIIGEDPSCGIPATIQAKKSSQGQWVASVRGVENRKALEGIRGQCLWASADDEEATLEGVSVIDSAGIELGKIIAVTNYGASDIVVIQSSEKKLIDLPLVDSFFVLPPSAEGTLELVIPQSDFSDLWYE